MTTFAEHVPRFLANLEARKKNPVKQTTIATFRSALNMALPILGPVELGKLDSEHMRRLVVHLCDRKLKPRTIRLAVVTSKKVVTSARDPRGKPLFNPQWSNEHIDVPSAKKPKHPSMPELATQIEIALAVAPPTIREFVALQAAAGLRKGEVLALNVEDFDAAAGLLRVARTRGYYGETVHKTEAGERAVDLAPEIVTMLQEMLGARTTGRLFPVTIDEVRWAFKKLKIRSHSLRHFRVTHLRRNAVPEDILRFWIGHGSVGITDIYSHLDQYAERRRQIAREVGLGFTIPQRVIAGAPVMVEEMVTA